MPLSNLAEGIEIGPYVYAVTENHDEYNRAAADHGGDVWGHISYPRGQIVINPNQTEAHKRVALLHEVMHGVYHITDISHKHDEAIIRALAASLLDTLRRNPALVAYLMEGVLTIRREHAS